MDRNKSVVTGEGNAPRATYEQIESSRELHLKRADQWRGKYYELKRSINICVGAAGVGEESELCGWIDAIKSQRDELLAALKEIAEVAYSDETQYVRIAKAAIAKVEGGGQ